MHPVEMRLPESQGVVVTDIHIPFWSMVVFMVKWAIAAVPAVLILLLLAFAGSALVKAGAEAWGQMQDRAADTAAVERARQRALAAIRAPAPAVGPTFSEQFCASVGGDREECLQFALRCAGTPDFQKCIADEVALRHKSLEQREAGRKSLDDERRANMQKVR